MQSVKYKSRPLDAWKKAKELRHNHYMDVMTAKEKGKLLVEGGTEGLISLPAGLGEDYVYFGGEPYGATIAADPKFSLECMEAVESHNFARDMCSYMRNYWGSMFLDKTPFGTKFPKPDFCFQLHICDSHAKWYQFVSEYYGVPYFAIEAPPITVKNGVLDMGNFDKRVEYMTDEMLACIDWMQKITGRKYNDDLFRKAVTNECLSTRTWAAVCSLQKNIPAPLDQKTMFSLYIISVLVRFRDESREFYEMLLDEVKDRVANKIAALPTERKRILDDSQPPWYFLKLYRQMEEYGAVTIGSHYSFLLAGAFSEHSDGTWGPSQTPAERGMPMKSRRDICKALATWYCERPVFEGLLMPMYRNQQIVRLAKEWKADAVLLHYNRGCEGLTQTIPEQRLALQKEGLVVGTYEGNMGDSRELDEAQVIDRIDALMETLGLNKIPADAK
ncbi:MAG: benzoyl-CoA reductase, bzd-type, subunit O [Dehalococcoidia bacterium]|nr:benzoyl-CoA reductase, bzd-type, subunit O [Dehalococcoidia bacterium]